MLRIKKIALAAIMALTFVLMTACGTNHTAVSESKEDEHKPAVAYMIAHTANAKPIDSTAPLLENTMVDCAENFGYTFIVRVDGDSAVVASENLDIPDRFKNASSERLKLDAQSKATHLLETLDNVRAVYPEADYLEGLRTAAACLRSLDTGYTTRSIICCGTGLGTQGYMDFRNNLLSADPEMIVAMLEEREALPDLNGITVYWLGMGQVADPQPKLLPKQANNLQAIWKAVIEASGGEFVPNDYITVTSEMDTSETLPEMSIVDLPSDTPWRYEPENFEQSKHDDHIFEEPFVLDGQQVEFIGDEDNYLHPDKAVATLRPIAEYLIEHESVPILLVGACAGDESNESVLQLSQHRAEAVKQTLTELGVNEKRITAIGMGTHDPWHVKGAGTEGPIAISNRKVVLLDARTALAIELINNN